MESNETENYLICAKFDNMFANSIQAQMCGMRNG